MSKKKPGVVETMEAQVRGENPVDAFSEELETQDATNSPKVGRPKRPKELKTVVSGAAYHDFEKEPVYQGHFVKLFKAPKDIPKNQKKKGDTIGFEFVDEKGKISIISNSYSINKALEEDEFSTETMWWIEFMGKETAGGKPFNRFYVAKF